jgi:hypothetical protein
LRELSITEFSSKFSKHGNVISTQWVDFVDSIKGVGHVSLENKEYGAAIVGGRSLNGRHQIKSFKSVDLLIFDCDHVSYNQLYSWLVDNYGNYAWLLYSTYSHTPFDGRFRVVFPTKTPIEKDEYLSVWSDIDIPGKDASTKDISRLAYLPSTRNGNGGIIISNDVDQFYDFLEISSGHRNSKIAQLVGHWCNGKKIKKEELLKKAQHANQTRCDPPLDEQEIETIVNSIWEKEKQAREDGKHVYDEKKISKAKLAFDLALSQCELFKGDTGEAIVKINDIYCLVESVYFASWLITRFHETFDDIIGKSQFGDTIHTLKGVALAQNETIPVFRRIGWNDEDQTLVYYLGNQKYVHINKNNWRVIEGDSCNLCCVQEPTLEIYDEPVIADVNELWPLLRSFFNVKDGDFSLILAWILGSFWPNGPYPIMIKTGEQGSAKSTGTEFCAKIVDSRKPALLRPPKKDSDDLYVSAFSRHILAIDNVSYIDDGFSDDLCRLATGAGFQKRKLYTDFETANFDGARPIILNSIISTIAGRGDLLDRAMVVEYQPMTQYLSSDLIMKRFSEVLPKVHYIIFTLLVEIINNLSFYEQSNLVNSRMGAFENRIKASNIAWGGYFEQNYNRNRSEINAGFVAGDEVYEALIMYFESNSGTYWEGRATDLVKALKFGYDSKFRSVKAFGRHIERIKPNLRKSGINVIKSHSRSGSKYHITYKRKYHA